jgi:DNA-binding transcriptional LysR family regulator
MPIRFTLTQIEAFCWIARLGTFQEAAKQLNLSQPTISLRVRNLERALGARLFERLGRGVRLSTEGTALFAHAATLLDAARQIEEQVAPGESVEGMLHIGVQENFAVTCLPELVDILNRDYPALRLHVDIATSPSLARQLEERKIDLAFFVSTDDNPRFHVLPLGQYDMVLAASPRHGLKPPVRPGDVRALPIISNPPPSRMFGTIRDWFRTAGLEPLRLSLCSSVSLIAHLVASGVAVSVLPLPLIQADIAAGRITALPTRPGIPEETLYAGYRAGERAATIAAVIRATRKVLKRTPFLTPV